MNELISLQPHATLTQAVNARELHTFLEVQTRFNDWIAARITDYAFVENQDYVRFTENSVKPQGGRPSIGYFISLDMAKELSMVERNEQGKEARRYFIECEKQLNAQQSQLPTTYLEALEALLASEKEKLTLEQQASINAPKVAHYDRVVARTNLVNATHVASKLKLSAVKLNRHLCELGVYNQAVKRGKVFNTWFIDKGYGQMKQTELGYDQALFTHAGEMWVIEMMISEGVVG